MAPVSSIPTLAPEFPPPQTMSAPNRLESVLAPVYLGPMYPVPVQTLSFPMVSAQMDMADDWSSESGDNSMTSEENMGQDPPNVQMQLASQVSSLVPVLDYISQNVEVAEEWSSASKSSRSNEPAEEPVIQPALVSLASAPDEVADLWLSASGDSTSSDEETADPSIKSLFYETAAGGKDCLNIFLLSSSNSHLANEWSKSNSSDTHPPGESVADNWDSSNEDELFLGSTPLPSSSLMTSSKSPSAVAGPSHQFEAKDFAYLYDEMFEDSDTEDDEF